MRRLIRQVRLDTCGQMEIESILHKALRNFFTEGRAKGLIESRQLRNMLQFITDAESFDELAIAPNFGLHALVGDRVGTYAMTVTKNWQLTFVRIDEETIAALDLEDYH